MKSVAVFALIAMVGSAMAQTIEPTVGDVGSIQICNDGSEDCTLCAAQRKEDEGENGEEQDSSAPTQVCLDKCSHNGYTITQEANTEVSDGNGGVVTYRNIKLSPKNMACIAGCECPEGKGTMVYEASDDQEAEVYTVTFFDRRQQADKGYLSGEVTVDYTEGEINQISMAVDYFAMETRDDGKEEAREEQCILKFYIASGTIGGIAAASGEPNPTPIVYHVGESLGQVAMVHDKTPAQGCTFGDEPADATEEADWCMYKCAQGYTANIINTTIVMVPKETFISLDCMCEVGFGIQNAGGNDVAQFSHAEVSFTQATTNMCSSTFVGEVALVEVVSKNTEYDNAFTMRFPNSKWTADAKTYCTYRYAVNSGEVLGVEASLEQSSESKGKVAFALFLAVAVLFAFFVPGCLPKKGQNYDSVP